MYAAFAEAVLLTTYPLHSECNSRAKPTCARVGCLADTLPTAGSSGTEALTEATRRPSKPACGAFTGYHAPSPQLHSCAQWPEGPLQSAFIGFRYRDYILLRSN